MSFVKNIETPMLILVGNKIDLDESNRQISKQDGEKFAEKENILFFEVSAKENLNIRRMLFSSVIELPVFDSIRESVKDKNLLLDEIEYENNEININSNSLIDSSRINISMSNPTPEGRKICKC